MSNIDSDFARSKVPPPSSGMDAAILYGLAAWVAMIFLLMIVFAVPALLAFAAVTAVAVCGGGPLLWIRHTRRKAKLAAIRDAQLAEMRAKL